MLRINAPGLFTSRKSVPWAAVEAAAHDTHIRVRFLARIFEPARCYQIGLEAISADRAAAGEGRNRIANSLKTKVGSWGLEPQTSTVSS